jgi:hypothetical protein
MIRSLVFLTVFTFASSAFAQAYDRNGPALGASVGFAIEDFDDGGIDFDNSGVAGATFSYRVHPHIGLEGRFEHTFNFDGNAPFNDLDVNIWNLTANGQIFILTGQFQPYFALGFGIGQAEIDVHGPGGFNDTTTDAVGRVGLGLDSYLTPNVVLGFEGIYNFGFGDMDDFNYASLEALLKYRF